MACPTRRSPRWPCPGELETAEGKLPDFFEGETARFENAGDLIEPMLGTIKATRSARKEFEAERDGAKVRGTLRVKTKTPATALVLLLPMAPHPSKDESDTPKGKEP